MTYYVNATREEARKAYAPRDRDRHRSPEEAKAAQVREGWLCPGAAVILVVDEDGYSYGRVV